MGTRLFPIRSLLWPTALLLTISASANQPATPQTRPPSPLPQVTFRVDINYVEVDAIVVDATGAFVPDLTREDFDVLEDGVQQTITTFGLVNIPIEREEVPLFARQPIEPDVTTNTQATDGRLFLIVLDDYHVSALRSNRVRRAAREFVERHLGANDLAAVVSTSGRTHSAQDFTSNRRLLIAAIDQFVGQKLPSATANRIAEYERLRQAHQTPTIDTTIKDVDEAQRAYHARNTLRVLKNAADFLAGVRGRRKALVFISEGIDYDVTNVFENLSATDIVRDTRDAIGAATRANVSIYSIDPRGLTDVGEDAIEMPGLSTDAIAIIGPTALQREVQRAQESLRVIAEETGGFAIVNSNDIRGGFERIQRDNSAYYVLGYYPKNDRRDGRYRTIDVRVKRPGVQVRARRGYVAPRGSEPPGRAVETPDGTSRAVSEALASPVPVSALTMAVFAAAFKGTLPNASVLVVVQADPQGLTLIEKDGRATGRLEFSVIAVDRQGKTRAASRQLVSMTPRPETLAAMKKWGVRFTERIEIPPGRYQIKVALGDPTRNVAGSVAYDLEVPDFRAEPLSMSGLALTSTRAGVTPTARPDELLRSMLPGPPTTSREFMAGEELALMTEVYDNEGGTPHTVDITTTLQSDDGRVLFTHAAERSTREFDAARGGFGYTTLVPLKGLSPGLYVLKVVAHSRLGREPTATRAVQFRIR